MTPNKIPSDEKILFKIRTREGITMIPLLCRFGLHWPMGKHDRSFYDPIGQTPVYRAICPCGRVWLVAWKRKFPFSKVKL